MVSVRSLAVSILVFVTSCEENVPEPKQTTAVNRVQVPVEERQRMSEIDKSPVDIIYYPEDFPVLKMSGKVTGEPIVRLIYSRPSKDGRDIFGNVVKYGTYWRLGANEGSEIEFFRDVIINKRRVRSGRYIIYCIPYERKWTIKLNDDLYTWGLRIHSNRDVYSFDAPVSKLNKPVEYFTMKFQKAEKGAELVMAWDSVKSVLPFTF